VDQRVAQVAVRLCDVWPDGASTLVTRGLLNLNQRAGSEPADLTPGEPINARVKLQAVAYRFPAGHSLRVAISSCAWPLAWPSPALVTLSLDPGQSSVELPVRRQPATEIEVSFSEAE
jgi:predicted acyl esterase